MSRRAQNERMVIIVNPCVEGFRWWGKFFVAVATATSDVSRRPTHQPAFHLLAISHFENLPQPETDDLVFLNSTNFYTQGS